ncbi:hypothetical protein LCGC14_1687690, partial [marine sediment metagenome]
MLSGTGRNEGIEPGSVVDTVSQKPGAGTYQLPATHDALLRLLQYIHGDRAYSRSRPIIE